MRRRRGPGLIGTAVVVGGAAHMGAKSAQRSQQEADQNAQIAELQRTAGGPGSRSCTLPPAEPTTTPREIQKYAALKGQGLITEEEFEAKKKQILGI